MLLLQARRVVLGAFLALIVIAGSHALRAPAAAECAWILWDGTLALGGTIWTISGTYPSSKNCNADLADKISIKRRNGEDATESSAGTALYKRGETRGYLYCLPDTVDPREPKAGGR